MVWVKNTVPYKLHDLQKPNRLVQIPNQNIVTAPQQISTQPVLSSTFQYLELYDYFLWNAFVLRTIGI